MKTLIKVIGFVAALAAALFVVGFLGRFFVGFFAPTHSTRIYLLPGGDFFGFDGPTQQLAMTIALIAAAAFLIAILFGFGIFLRSRSNLAGKIGAGLLSVLYGAMAFVAALFSTVALCDGGWEEYREDRRAYIAACERKYGLSGA